LTACGGGGDLGNPIDLSVPGASYSDLDEAADFLTSYRTTPNATSFSGTASYNGVMLMAEDLDPRLGDATPGVSSEGIVGQVELTADFTSANASGYTVSGSATNFYQTGIETSGTFQGNPDGTTTTPGGLSGTVNLSATGVTGNFFELVITSGSAVGGDSVSGSFDDNSSVSGRVAGFKSPDGTTPTALWVRTSESSGLTVGSNTLDAVIAAD